MDLDAGATWGVILRMDLRHIPLDWPIRPAFMYWPPAEAGGAIMDYRPLRILPLTVSQALFSQGFYGFFETCQVEDVSLSRQTPQHW